MYLGWILLLWAVTVEGQTWSDVCNITRQVCAVHPLNSRFSTVAEFLGSGSLLQANWTLLISPFPSTCLYTNCTTTPPFASCGSNGNVFIPALGCVSRAQALNGRFIYSTPEIVFTRWNITLQSTYAAYPVLFQTSIADATTNANAQVGVCSTWRIQATAVVLAYFDFDLSVCAVKAGSNKLADLTPISYIGNTAEQSRLIRITTLSHAVAVARFNHLVYTTAIDLEGVFLSNISNLNPTPLMRDNKVTFPNRQLIVVLWDFIGLVQIDSMKSSSLIYVQSMVTDIGNNLLVAQGDVLACNICYNATLFFGRQSATFGCPALPMPTPSDCKPVPIMSSTSTNTLVLVFLIVLFLIGAFISLYLIAKCVNYTHLQTRAGAQKYIADIQK